MAINSDAPTLALFVREKSKEFTEGLLMGWFVYLNELLNLNKPMSTDQIEMCVNEILNDYASLKFSDLTLLFKKIITGEYGEFYESLSIPKVISWFRDYFEQRCNIAAQESLRKHQDFTSDETFKISTNVKRIYRSLDKQ